MRHPLDDREQRDAPGRTGCRGRRDGRRMGVAAQPPLLTPASRMAAMRSSAMVVHSGLPPAAMMRS